LRGGAKQQNGQSGQRYLVNSGPIHAARSWSVDLDSLTMTFARFRAHFPFGSGVRN
jgi:hypothetical protein